MKSKFPIYTLRMPSILIYIYKYIYVLTILLCMLPSMLKGQRVSCGDSVLSANYFIPAHYDDIKKRNQMTQYYIDNVLTGKDKKFSPQAPLSSSSCSNFTYVIPVVFYILEDPTYMPSGTVTYSQVQSQLDALNSYYQAYNIHFCIPTTYPDNTTALPYTSSAEPGVFRIMSPLTNLTLTTNYNQFQNTDAPALSSMSPTTGSAPLSPDNYLRIFIVNDLDGYKNFATNGGTAGIGAIPDIISSLGWDFVAVNFRIFGNSTNTSIPNYCSTCSLFTGYDQGKILVHEVGHYLNLYHIFQNYCTIIYNNPSLDGDAVPDTDPINTSGVNSGSTCTTNANNYCFGQTTTFDDGNYMEYASTDHCLSQFSPGQAKRIYACLAMYRQDLSSPQNLYNVGIGCTGNINAAVFNISTTNVCLGSSITCTAASYPTGYTISWNYGDGTAPGAGTSVSHTYSSTGQYILTFTLIDNYGNIVGCYTTDIYVTECMVNNCTQGNWYFGYYAGLNFTTSGVQVDYGAYNNFTMNTIEAAVTVSDANCHLLFYSDGIDVWNNAHTKINPTALTGQTSTSQALAVPNPGNANQYYLFTVDDNQNNTNPFAYSLIDISGTTASMKVGNCNIPVTLPTGVNHVGEGMTAIVDCSGTGYWIITTSGHGRITSGVIVYHLTAAGLSTTPKMFFQNMYDFDGNGPIIKASPDGSKVCVSTVSLYNSLNFTISLLMDFDASNGTLTNPVALQTYNGNFDWGMSFSPSSQYLYIAEGGYPYTIYQYDVTATNIQTSKTYIASCAATYSVLELGPDGKIYCTQSSTSFLSAINYPDRAGAACLFQPNAVYLPGPKGYNMYTSLSLPNMVDALNSASPGAITFSASAQNCTEYKFYTNHINCSSVTLLWNFGDPTSAYNTSVIPNPTHTFTITGTYTITLTINGTTTITKTITIGISSLAISGPTTYTYVCNSLIPSSYSVTSAPTAGVTYTWNVYPPNFGPQSQFVGSNSIDVFWPNSSGTGEIEVVATDGNGCQTIQDYYVTITSTTCCSSSSSPYGFVYDIGANSTISGNNMDKVSHFNTQYGTTNINCSSCTAGNNIMIIDGDFEIDQDFTMSGFEVLITPNSTITVDAEKTLTISNCHLHACQSSMWDSIVVNNAGELIVNSGSIIEDAKTAVSVFDCGIIQLQNSTFNKNHVHVDIINPLNCGITTSYISGDIIDICTFECTAGLLDPYAGGHTKYAITGYNMSNDLIIGNTLTLSKLTPSNSNGFTQCDAGIYFEDNLTVTIQNNRFNNIVPNTNSATAPPLANGYAIYMNQFGAGTLTYGGLPYSDNSNIVANNISGCTYGIGINECVSYINNCSISDATGYPLTTGISGVNAIIDAEYNMITNPQTGILDFSQLSTYSSPQIGIVAKHNVITNCQSGIFCQFNQKSTNIYNVIKPADFENNIISTQNSVITIYSTPCPQIYYGSGGYHLVCPGGPVGIVYSTTTGLGNSIIAQSNTINLNGICGIYSIGDANSIIKQNNITIASPYSTTNKYTSYPPSYGIRLFNSISPSITCNAIISATYSTSTSYNRNGIQLNSSQGALMAGNTIQNMRLGSQFISTCTNAQIRSNYFYNMLTPIYAGQGSTAGDIGSQNPITVSGHSESPGNEFYGDGSTNYTKVPARFYTNGTFYGAGTAPIQIITTEYNSVHPKATYYNGYSLIGYLNPRQTILTPNSWGCPTLEGGGGGGLSGRAAIAGVIQPINTADIPSAKIALAGISQYLASDPASDPMGVLIGETKHVYLYSYLKQNSASVPISGNIQNVSNTNFAKIADVTLNLSSAATDTIPNDSINIANYLATATALNNTINTSGADDYITNQKAINTIKIKWFNPAHAIDSADTTLINYVAMQCPNTFGPVVYDARAMQALYKPFILYNDDACIQEPITSLNLANKSDTIIDTCAIASLTKVYSATAVLGSGFTDNCTFTWLLTGAASDTIYNTNSNSDSIKVVWKKSSPVKKVIVISDYGTYDLADSVNITTIGNSHITVSASASPDTLCSGATVILTATASASDSGRLYYTWGMNTDTMHILTVKPEVTTTYTVTVENSKNSCTSSATAVVVVNPTPTATLSGGGTICSGGIDTLSVDLTGSAPWSLTWSDGTTSHVVTGITQNFYQFTVSPSINTIYSLTALSDANCTVAIGGMTGSASVTVRNTPASFIIGSTTICNGDSTQLSIILSGIGPWDIIYKDSTRSDTLTDITTNPYTFEVKPAHTHTYKITSMRDVHCPAQTGSMLDSVVVSVNSLPCDSSHGGGGDSSGCTPPTSVLSGTAVICKGSSTTLSVALTGKAPWALTWFDGITPHNVTGITSSPYTFNVSPTTTSIYTIIALSDSGSCTAGSSNMTGYAIVSENNLPVVDIIDNTISTICNGSTATITVALTGTAPWSLTWNNGTAHNITGITSNPYTFSVSPTITTIYNVTALSDSSCMASSGILDSEIVTVDTLPTATISGHDTICPGNTASISVSLTGTPPWSIIYTDGTTLYPINGIMNSPYTFIVDPIVNTTYHIMALSDVHCSADSAGMTDSAVVVMKTSPADSIIGSRSICAGGTDTLKVYLTGTSPWALTWTDGTTAHNVTGITASPYIIIVTPTVTTTYSVTGLSDPICTAQPIDMKGKAIVTVDVPTSVITGTTTMCVGADSTTISIALTGAAPWALTWSDGTTSHSITGIESNFYTFNVLPTTTTTYYVTALSDTFCTASSGNLKDSAIITLHALPVSVITGTNATICAGQSTNILDTITASGSWLVILSDGSIDTGTGNKSIIIPVSPLNTTAYTVWSITDQYCTNDTGIGTATITVNPRPMGSINGADSICTGSSTTLSINLTGTEPWALTWSDGTTLHNVTGITSSPYTISVDPTVTTTYKVTALSDAHCTSDSADIAHSHILTIHSLPTITASTNHSSICIGSSATLTSSGGSTYTWSPSTGLSATTGSSITASPTATTTYTVTGIGSYGCTNTDTVSVKVNALPTIPASTNHASICIGSSATLTSGGGISYSWSPSTGLSATTGNSITASPTITTTYTVTGTNSNGCVNTDTVSVKVNNLPTIIASASPITICYGATSTLTASGGSTYSWSPSITLSASTGSSVTSTPTATTTYTVTGTNSNGCVNTDTVSVRVKSLPTITASASPTAICTGSSTTLSAGGGVSYSWSPSTGLTVTTGSSITASPTTTSTYTITYTVTGTGSDGCTNTHTVAITVYGLPTISTTPGNTHVCTGSSTSITAIGGSTYSWSPSSTLSASTGSPVTASPTTTATYTVTGTDSHGCINTVSLIDTVYSLPTITATLTPGVPNTLTGGGGVTYTWSPSTGLSATTGGSVTALPATSTTYTVTGTNSHGCSSTATTSVVYSCAGINCVGTPFTYTTGGYRHSTYKFHNLATAIRSVKASSLSKTGGTYSDSIYNNTTGSLYSSTAFAGYGITTSYTGLYKISNDTFSISGAVELDSSVVFDNCLFYMNTDAKIIFDRGVIQFKNGTILKACGSYMWDGIYTQDSVGDIILSFKGTHSNPYNTTLQDAENGIVVNNPNTMLDISATTFTNNYYSIKDIQNSQSIINGGYGTGGTPWIGFMIYNNKFSTSGSGITLSHDSFPSALGRPIAFINYYNVEYGQVGMIGQGYNYFSNAQIGLKLRNSYTYLQNNNFNNFLADQTTSPSGMAVYSSMSSIFPTTSGSGAKLTGLYAGLNYVSSVRNIFSNCDYGIIGAHAGVNSNNGYRNGGNVEIFHSSFTNVGYPIMATASGAQYFAGGVDSYSNNILIWDDSIMNCNGGITVSNLSVPNDSSYVAPVSLHRMLIDSCNIYAGGYTFSQPGSTKYGIYTSYNTSVAGVSDTIVNNNVYMQDSVMTGIEVTEGKSAEKITNNYVELPQTASIVMTGISLYNCSSSSITCNRVQSNYVAGTTTINNKGAIMLNSSTGVTLENNTTDNTEVGFGFSGTCTSSYMWANNIKYHAMGVFMGNWQTSAAGSISDQIYNHYPTGTSSIVNPGNNFIGSGSGTFASCSTCGAIYGTSSSSKHYFWVVNSSPYLAGYASGSKLRDTIDGSHSAYSSALTCTGDTSSTQPIFPKAESDAIIDGSNYNTAFPLITYMEKVNIYANIWQDTTIVYGDTILHHFLDTARNGSIGKFALVLYDMQEGIATGTSSYYTSALSVNSGITPHALWESNQQEYNSIYLNVLLSGTSFLTGSSTYETFINNLANSCVYTNGTSVYQARSLRLLFESVTTYNEGSYCSGDYRSRENTLPTIYAVAGDSVESFTIPYESVLVYPNPATQNIMFNYDLVSDGVLHITDLLGQPMTIQPLSKNAHLQSMSVSSLAAGLYLYNIVTKDGHTFKGKFEVTH